MIRTIPPKGQPLPEGLDPERDECAQCGDLIGWCPVWLDRWPHLASVIRREEVY